MIDYADFFPFWRDFGLARSATPCANAITLRHVSKGAVLHNGSEDCVGLFLVLKGQLRAYIVSDEGREITLYRLLERDMCLFSAACMMNSIQFDITISARTGERGAAHPHKGVSGADAAIRPGGELYERIDGLALYRCDVAARPDSL